ncbi:MAG: zf-HC2 domain-containing protein [Acidobacteria bacterium]|nr:zf-HC2 domain-containing protein [Acidobacteriota bacterium]
MLCADFEERLTDYLDGALDAQTSRDVAEHALRCPVCHELLSEVKNTMQACLLAEAPAAPAELEARILAQTMPETAMTCEEFEECLTDYLDGFLPAPLFHRWERHAALCERCTELPGQVVRSIGACYTYISEELPVPYGLHERILQATLGTTRSELVQAPLGARLAAWMRGLLDPLISPQLATVATMLLLAVLVLTNTVSADGSIGGMYSASLKLAEQSYSQGASRAVKPITDDLDRLTNGITTTLMEGNRQNRNSEPKPENAPDQKPEQKEQK